MMKRNKRIETVALRICMSTRLSNLIDEMVSAGGYTNRNELLRDAIRTQYNIMCADKTMFEKMKKHNRAGKKFPGYVKIEE